MAHSPPHPCTDSKGSTTTSCPGGPGGSVSVPVHILFGVESSLVVDLNRSASLRCAFTVLKSLNRDVQVKYTRVHYGPFKTPFKSGFFFKVRYFGERINL